MTENKSVKNSMKEKRKYRRKKRKPGGKQGVPYYSWINKNTNIIVEIQRKIKDVDFPPDKTELDDLMSLEEWADADWERLIGQDTQLISLADIWL